MVGKQESRYDKLEKKDSMLTTIRIKYMYRYQRITRITEGKTSMPSRLSQSRRKYCIVNGVRMVNRWYSQPCQMNG